MLGDILRPTVTSASLEGGVVPALRRRALRVRPRLAEVPQVPRNVSRNLEDAALRRVLTSEPATVDIEFSTANDGGRSRSSSTDRPGCDTRRDRRRRRRLLLNGRSSRTSSTSAVASQAAAPSAKAARTPKPTRQGDQETHTPPEGQSQCSHHEQRGKVTLAFVNVGQGDGIVIKDGSWAGTIDGGKEGNERSRIALSCVTSGSAAST